MFANQTSIQSFLDYLKFQKRYSRHTIISYQNDLEDFFDFIVNKYGNLSLNEISATLIRTWLANLKQNKIASKSINRKISALKSFFKYQLRRETLSVSPMATIASLKVSKRLPSFIEEKDIDTLFQHVQFPDTWEGETNRLLLQIFYQTGMRLSELINLKESQIDRSNNYIKVVGKGNKERIIPINNGLLNDILRYIKEKQNSTENSNIEYILINRGKKLQPKYVYNKVKEYLSYVTTNDRKSPHILRHSFATHLTNNGAGINAIKELLGHSSLAATQIYTHNSIEKLKEIHKKSHPKS
ncbi:MAG: tyrosine-type recombinase/integrase [Chitinophagaceae bacterium]